MRKYRSYIFLGLLLIVFLAVGYFFLSGKTKKVEIVEINFVSDHAIVSNSNETIPEYITTFAACYTENDSIDYISRISFKRIDVNNLNADSLDYGKAIDKNLKINEAQEMFANENKSIKSTKHMSIHDIGFKSGYKDDTLDTRYFYLVGENDPNVNLYPTIYFNSHEKLKEYINQELKSGTLFKGKKENKVTIILLKGTSASSAHAPGPEPEPVPPVGGDTKEPVPGPRPNPKEPVEHTKIDSDNDGILDSKDKCPNEYGSFSNKGCPVTILANFKEVGQNTLSWSEDLQKNAERITIVFKTKTGAKESYDVTGKNRYIFESYNNQFHRVYCTVELIVQLPQDIILKGVLKKEIWCLCSI